MSAQRNPYGLLPSPITPSSLSADKRLSDVCWDTTTHHLIWLEGRSSRGVLVSAPPDGSAPRDLTPEQSVRARVGYGGGDVAAAGGTVYYSAEGRLYRKSLDPGQPKPITPPFGDVASPAVSPNGNWVLYVHSDQHNDCLAIVDTDGERWPQKLVSGADFYMQPAWHPGGEQFAYVAWNHPLMPWDGTELHLARLASEQGDQPRLVSDTIVAGSEHVSVFQPVFSPDGRYLAYASDAEGWYGLYLHDLKSGISQPLWTAEAEMAVPAWAQGMRTLAWTPDSAAVWVICGANASDTLWRVPVDGGAPRQAGALADYTDLSQICVSAKGTVALIASSPLVPPRVIAYEPDSEAARVVARASSESVPASDLCPVSPVSWTAEDGTDVHGLLYLPADASSADEQKRPLIVHVHGGPTGQATCRYSGRLQFFATRGYAVLDVNYRGSAGYGRRYRNLLRENWGIYDADDAVSGARYLEEQGLVDGSRMVIMGGSAGGYTVLQSLTRFPGVFKAALCLYGVTNLFTLAADTHKFEQHYLDSLIGPLPETASRYRDRSPIFAADRISDPIAVFQGEDDRVVPKLQAETIVEILRRNGVPHEYHLYAGEGHGWRKAETVAAFHEAALRFLTQYVIYA